jgi:hypothetical protein
MSTQSSTLDSTLERHTPPDHHSHSHSHHHHHHPPIVHLDGDLAQRNAAHFDAIAHEHTHNHNVKHIASKIAERIVELLSLGPEPDQDDNDDNDDNDKSDKGITVLDHACGTGQSL